MPKIHIQTKINKPAPEAFSRFSDGLFESLIPPFIKIERNDGIHKGDQVIVQFKLAIIKPWHLEIIDNGQDEVSYWFTDKSISGGPFGIQDWTHIHRVKIVDQSQCIISDEIEFDTRNKILNVLVLSIFTLDMKLRKSKYKKFFEKIVI